MPQLEEEIVDFPAPDGGSLVGILSRPPAGVPEQKALLILSHSGLVHKPGSHRGQHNLAHYFASRGYPVFRFDPAGFGDSDGVTPEHVNQDLFASIESGRFVSSYTGAFDYLERRFKDHRWIVSGVCGGAISALLGGAENRHQIAGYALISCPVVLDGSQFDYSRREVPQMAKKRLKMYAAKLVSPKAIFRFLTFRSDYGRIWAMAKTLLLRTVDKVFRRPKAGEKKPAQAKALEAAKPDEKPRVGLSARFVKAAREAMQRSKVLFIYGNNDGFLWEFTDLYAAAHLSQAKRDEVLRVVEHANHMFQWNEWQQQAFALIQDWLTSIVLLT